MTNGLGRAGRSDPRRAFTSRTALFLALSCALLAECLESRLRADLVSEDETWLVVAENAEAARQLLGQLTQCVPFHSADGRTHEDEKVRCVVATMGMGPGAGLHVNSTCDMSSIEQRLCARGPFAVYDLGAAPPNALTALAALTAALVIVRDVVTPNLVISTVSNASVGTALGQAIRSTFPHVDKRTRERAPIVWPLEQLHSLTWVGMLPAIALTRWHVPHLTVVAITWRRPESLTRLLTSLRQSFYFGDHVNLRFEVDGGHDNETAAIVRAGVGRWPFGEASHRLRQKNVGLATAVLESYNPAAGADHEYAVLLEDDIEVSASFYGWLKYTLLAFRHGRQSARDPRLLGVSLYTPRLEELARPRRRLTHYATLGGRPFAQQLPCSWGALYFPEHWRRFRAYQSVRTSDTFDSSQILAKPPDFTDAAVRWRYWYKSQLRTARVATANGTRLGYLGAPTRRVPDALPPGLAALVAARVARQATRTRVAARVSGPRRSRRRALAASGGPGGQGRAQEAFRPKLNLLSERIIIPKTVVHTWRASWKKFMIEMMYLRGEFMLYPNHPEERSFSTNHLEKGVHIGAEAAGKAGSGTVIVHRKEDYTVPLHGAVFADPRQGWVPLPDRAAMLPHLNLTANVTTPQVVDSRAAALLNLPKHRALQGFMHKADEAERSKFTVVLNTFKRDACLNKCVLAWLACPAVAQLRVVWSETGRELPAFLRRLQLTNPRRLVVDEYTLNRLSNRLRPVPQAPTIAVFVGDDDLYFGCAVLREAHERWLRAERKGLRPMLGFAPRFLRPDGTYDPHTAYDREMQRNVIFATKGAFVHRDDLELFWAPRFAPAVSAVDRYMTAEDITFALAHSAAQRLPPIVVGLHRKQVTELCCTPDAAAPAHSNLPADRRTCALAKNRSLHSRTRWHRSKVFRLGLDAAGGQAALDRVQSVETVLLDSTVSLLKADLATIVPYEKGLAGSAYLKGGRNAQKPQALGDVMQRCLEILTQAQAQAANREGRHGRRLIVHQAHVSERASMMVRCLVRWYHPPYLLLARI